MADEGQQKELREDGNKKREDGNKKRESVKKPTGWNSFYQSVAADVNEELGPAGIRNGKVSSVVSRMWRNLPSDRRKDWKDKAQWWREDMDTGLLVKMKCPTCGKEFSRDKDCRYHMKGCRQCICEYSGCEVTFDHELKLARHKKKAHLESFKCTECSKVFAERRNLRRHQTVHQKN